MKKIDINKLVRKNILNLKPYSSARAEFKGNEGIFLNANENPFGNLNRYPDPLQVELKQKFSELKSVPVENIFIGNGSDEIIDLAFRIFCNPGKDKALIFTPTYGMYEVSAEISNVEMIKVPLNQSFQIDFNSTESNLNDKQLKLIFICSPNNPTGNSIENIESILKSFNGIVIIDEAYIDFSKNNSYINKILEYPNLIVMQTMSKAWGLASARIGIAYSNPEIISYFNKIKPPYNVSKLNQEAALNALENISDFEKNKSKILKQKEFLKKELIKMPLIKKVFPSDANFILVETSNTDKVYSDLLERKIITRNRNSIIENCIRITVGNAFENEMLLFALNEISGNKNVLKNEIQFLKTKKRTSRVIRKTSETSVFIDLNIDGTGKSNISTGIRFFDHMLAQIAKHGNIDLIIKAKGDLEVDKHHTIEDIGISLGEAFSKALENKKGIERYGFLLPMDDSLAQVAIDFGGRSWLVWNVEFKNIMLGEMPTEMFMHFFKSFSDNAKCNLNIKAEGENEHHKIEAVFKAFAKSIKMAASKTNNNNIPSTKGSL